MKKNISKIKKYTLPVLILVVFLVVLGFTSQVSASRLNPQERCDHPLESESSNQPCLGAGSITSSTSGDFCAGLVGIGKLICQFHKILDATLPVLVSLAVVYFVWGVVQYVIAGGDEAKKKGKDRIIYGIICLAVIISVWGLVAIVVQTFDLGGVSAPTLVPITSSDSGSSAGCSLAGNPKFQDLLCYVVRIINNSIIPFIFAIAFVFFIWGTVKFFLIGADDEKSKTQGKQFMIWGIVALAVMLSVWGLVAILGSTFGLNTSVLPQVKP